VSPALEQQFIIEAEWGLTITAFFLGSLLAMSVAHRISQVRVLRARRLAVLHERRRVALNLHDGVGHGLVVMAMHARRLLTATSEASQRQTAEVIETVAQSTLADLSATLGCLRSDDSGDLRPVEVPAHPEEAPLSVRLLELIRLVPASGAEVKLHDLIEEHHVPPDVAATAFRVAQEALTNALKHNSARIRLEVHFGRELVVTLTNEALLPAATTVAYPRGGFGLAGLRERVAVHGGSLDARPLPGGLFATRAIIPITREDELCRASAC
jgi:signal transduction histidine kinase